jgi:hypothetical protein
MNFEPSVLYHNDLLIQMNLDDSILFKPKSNKILIERDDVVEELPYEESADTDAAAAAGRVIVDIEELLQEDVQPQDDPTTMEEMSLTPQETTALKKIKIDINELNDKMDNDDLHSVSGSVTGSNSSSSSTNTKYKHLKINELRTLYISKGIAGGGQDANRLKKNDIISLLEEFDNNTAGDVL